MTQLETPLTRQGNAAKDRRTLMDQSAKRIRRANRGWVFLSLTGSLLLATTNASAETYTRTATTPGSSYYISAPVVNVSPITTQRTVSTPVRQCRTETVYTDQRYEHGRRNENLFLPGLVGGIVGGLIGNQFGGGNGRKALTIAGALAGSSIARDAARHNGRASQPREVCHTSYETRYVDDVSAYDVTYEYAGQLFSKRMSQHPGNSVQVRVALEPAVGET